MKKEQGKDLTSLTVDQWPVLNQLLYYWLVLTNSDARRGFFSNQELYQVPDTKTLENMYEAAASFRLADLWHPNRSKSD